jgi:hypothetical protein
MNTPADAASSPLHTLPQLHHHGASGSHASSLRSSRPGLNITSKLKEVRHM